ncbi:hypothetical protein S7711_00322 [Stachybotrys chartarum IBT 7711]|uniref:Uncharacterized protein n=1 Tax=Stachybotrys chartarum (strain CBS 109288 / IBT 7711) TaxID=1280523 RepID=A0A084B9D3_STACB|nr:hypothetical protein S7711_00322 [Stachybotrys chartarum IBT 7711]
MPRPKRGRPAQAGRDVEATSKKSNAHLDSDGHMLQVAVAVTERAVRKTRSSGSRLSLAEDKAIHTAKRNRDAALDRLANEDATTAITSTSGDAIEDEPTGSSVEIGRHAAATPAQRRDTTGLDLADDDVFGDLDDSFGVGDLPEAPSSAGASSISMSHYKPRSRQSSFIGRNDPPIRPSSRAGGTTPGVGSTLNLGLFKRRAREPSILGTSRKPRPESETETMSGGARPRSDEDEDDFAPEAESTPLNNKRRRTQVPRSSPPESGEEPQADVAESPTTGPRKRKSEEGHNSNERPDKSARRRSETPIMSIEMDSDSELSSLASSPRLPGPLLQRPVTPINLEEIIAPPASSDSEEADAVWPDIHTLAKRRRRPSMTTPIRAGNMSDISSPPSLTHSPNYPETRHGKARGRAATRRNASPSLTTADLTNLLPKRRHRKARDPLDLSSDEELDATGLNQNEDELSYLDTRAARRRKGSRPPSRGASRPGSRAAQTSRPAVRSKLVAAGAGSAKSRIRATYSRRSSDKENESEGDDDDSNELGAEASEEITSSIQEALSADELKQAAKKFKEVDKWELDFEEVTESSSPAGAR